MKQRNLNAYHGNQIIRIIGCFLFISLTIFSSGCGQAKEKIRPGSICTIEDGDGKFAVVKILVIDDKDAHIKIYKNKYAQRPDKIDLKTLSMGTINDKDGFGIGHLPLDRKEFDNSKPVCIDYEEVTKDELEGYEIWKNQ